MSIETFHSWWTVLLVILFVAIVAWAWSGKRKKLFDQAARMPLDEDEPAKPADISGVRHG